MLVQLLVLLCELFVNAEILIILRWTTDHLVLNLCGRIPTE